MKLHDRVGIYIIICKVNRKVYIGSSLNIGRRLIGHRHAIKSDNYNNKDLRKDYLLYGVDAFTFDGLEYCEKDQLEDRENYWIDFYKARSKEFGYNKMKADRSTIVEGGHDGIPVTAIPVAGGDIIEFESIYKCSRELGIKITMISRIVKYWNTDIPDEQKHGEFRGGFQRSYNGYIIVRTDQYDPTYDYMNYTKKPSKKKEKVPVPIEERALGRKEVRIISDTGEQLFPSASAAALKLGIPVRKVTDIAAGRRKMYKGYRAEYTGKWDRVTEQFQKDLLATS